MKLVIDMNLSVAWVTRLRDKGIDAVHWSKIGAQNASDDLIMEWAEANDAVVLTRDLDFGVALARHGRISPSVIQIRCGRIETDRHLPIVADVLAAHREPLEAGAIVTIDEDRVRVRILDLSAKP